MATEASNDKNTTKPCLGLVHTKANQATCDDVENEECDTGSQIWDILPQEDGWSCAWYGFKDCHFV